MPIKTAAEIFRDYETDGLPSSGVHAPNKSDIRELLGAIETALGFPESTAVQAIQNDVNRLMIARRSFLFQQAI